MQASPTAVEGTGEQGQEAGAASGHLLSPQIDILGSSLPLTR